MRHNLPKCIDFTPKICYIKCGTLFRVFIAIVNIYYFIKDGKFP